MRAGTTRHLFSCAPASLLANAALGLGLLLGFVPSAFAQFPDVTTVDSDQFGGVSYSVGDRIRNAGNAVAHAGDINKDGLPDLLIGADGHGIVPGHVYVALGGQRGPLRRELPGLSESVIDLRTGLSLPDRFGFFVAGAGDVDGDGIDDILIGAPADGNPVLPHGGVFLVFGAERLRGPVDLSADPTRAILFTIAEPRGTLGLAGAGIGDVNADGFADIALGVPDALTSSEGGPLKATGKVLVVFGGPNLRSGPRVVFLDSLAPPSGFEIPGIEESSEFGFSVAGAGDFDHNGVADFVVGAPGQRSNGSVYVVFGRIGLVAAPNLTSPDGTSAIELRSALARSRLGEALAGGTDATGDGNVDVLAGAPQAESEGAPAGEALLFPGGPAVHGDGVQLVPAAGTVTFRGPRSSRTGASVSFVPDVNGNDVAEVLVGAPNARGGRGEAYLVYGAVTPGDAVFLEQISKPHGAIFEANEGGSRLGSAVAGLPDRNGDLRGDFALGAPGFPLRDAPGAGAVFETTLPADPESPAPRDLRATLIPGGKVVLTWTISRVYRFLRVFRDGARLEGSLPGHLQQFIDVSPGSGSHVYFVEADGDAGLRSNLAEVKVKGLPVRDLTCKQLERTLQVGVSWVAGDVYESLLVAVDGRHVSDMLSPHETSFVFETTPGLHTVEVFDPLGSPDAEHARCTVQVNQPDLPSIQNFDCVLVPPQTVHLSWQPSPAYGAYILTRNGVLVAKIAGGGEYLDKAVPTGEQRYALIGVNDNLHHGQPVACELIVPRQGPLFLHGRVSWAGDGPVLAGTVLVTDSEGKSISEAQVTESGQFLVSVERATTYRVTFKARLDADTIHSVATPPEERRISVTVTAASLDDELLIEVPPPVFLVSSLGSETPEQGPAARWRTLRNEIGERALEFAVVLPAGIASGARFLDFAVRDVKSHIATELGSAPRSVDIIAYGSAGLSARAYIAGVPGHPVRKLALLGTPNLGTARGHLEARAELAGRPIRAGGDDGGGTGPGEDEFVFSGAAEQTVEFLAEFNRRVNFTRGTEVHLIAGTVGLSVLDPVLDCASHDDRVCEESALGGVPGAHAHRVAENHETLGRGTESISILMTQVLGLESGAGAGGTAAHDDAAPAGAGGGDGSGGVATSHPPGDIYSGVLEPGGTGAFPLVSDTSESIIIILNSELPGGIRFDVVTPSGKTVDPPAAGALQEVDYQTYGDGEGHEVQAYKFQPSEPGDYVALLDNPANNVPIQYTLEAYVESGLALEAAVEPGEIDLGGNAVVIAALTRNGLPETGSAAEARVWRPDGSLEVLPLLDDGVGVDAAGGDGIYSAAVTSASQPGIHEVEVSATGSVGLITLYRREITTRFQVRSDAAEFGGGGFASGSADDDNDQVFESLYVEGKMIANAPGVFLVLGKLNDQAGNLVAQGGTLFGLSAPQTAGFRVYFEGSDIFAAHRNGPYVLSEIVILDGSAGFVEADRRENAHTTAAFSWSQFGLAPNPVQKYVRGDTNADGKVDISDGIAILDFLFSGTAAIGCRDAANANGDANLNLSDAVFLFAYLFGGGEPPPPPFPACGASEKLGCDAHPPCK